MTDDGERLALVGLSRVLEPGCRAVAAALELGTATELWDRLVRGRPVAGLGPLARDGIAARLDGYQPQRDLERLHALGGRVVCRGDDEWPEQRLTWDVDRLGGDKGRDLAPPWALFLRGPHHLREVVDASVAVVGARAATAYGEHVARELALGLAEHGLSIVSGAAYGIDGSAHRAALGAEAAPTVAVLACGVDVAYPRGHDRLLGQIAERGLLVSEWPPGCAPTRNRFLVRNRVIAALSVGTVVVEAAVRSGSLSTAGRAAELGRHVMAVPGPVTSTMSAGCHALVRDTAASLVTSTADVLDLLGRPGEHLAPRLRAAAHPRDALDLSVRQVLDAVPVRSPVGVARIARAAGVGALFVQQVLPALLVAGLVEQRDGGWRLTSLGASG